MNTNVRLSRRKIVFFASALFSCLYLSCTTIQCIQRIMRPHCEFCGHGFGLSQRAYKEYLVEHEGELPPMRSTADFIAAMAREPVFSNKSALEVEALFVEEASGKPHHVNTWLHGKNIENTPDVYKMVVLYDDAFSDDASRLLTLRERHFTRAIMYADGHATFLLENEWPQIKKQSHIP